MNASNSVRRRALAGFLSCSLGMGGLVFADDPAPALYDFPVQKSYIGEASRAIVGRVFGIGGDAGDIKYHELELTAHTPGNAAIRSLLVPGWGQFFNRQNAKGTLFFLTVVGAAIAGVRQSKKADDSYDLYKNRGSKGDPSYDDYVHARTRAYVFGGAAIGFWLVAIFDAHKNAYAPLYSGAQKRKVDLVFTDEGAGVVYKKNF